MHLVEPTRMGALSMTQHQTALVRALFGQFCSAVGHAATAKGTVHCAADFGVSYSGTFYDGSRALARFVYGASGCQTVSLTADGKTQSTMVFGAASPPRRSCGPTWPRSSVCPPRCWLSRSRSPARPARTSYGRLPDSSRSNSPSLTPRTNASHSASVK